MVNVRCKQRKKIYLNPQRRQLVKARVLFLFSFFLLFPSVQIYSQTARCAEGSTQCALVSDPPSNEQPIYNYQAAVHPVAARKGMVSTQNDLATHVGLNILKKGGNAVDAAVAVGFALAVTLPRAGNLGGGGFMLIHLASSKKTICIDYREKAPLRASRDMFLDENGEADPRKSRYGYLAVGVPGTVAGLTLALKKYGSMSLKEVMKPAIRLAGFGFIVNYDLEQSLIASKKEMQKYPATMAVFFKKNGQPYQKGERLRQKALASSLMKISREGASVFYTGSIADLIVSDMKKHGGLIGHQDLKIYDPVIRKPVSGFYRGHQVLSMPPPSSGGVHLIQMLNILEKYDLGSMQHNSARSIHLLSEVMKRAYADRFQYLGDTDFVSVPVAKLISKKYADVLRSEIHLTRATPSKLVFPGKPHQIKESRETTHFTVVDQYGNAVSNTYTLNFSYGMKAVVKGTGILLNNEMDDFTAKANSTNAYALMGGKKNMIAPKKRMLSSMSPTIVLKKGRFFLATGSPGGSRIITTVLQILLNVIDHKMNIAEATYAARVHHQWFPDLLMFEKNLNYDTRELLKKKGHKIKMVPGMGSTQSILRKNGFFWGASDPRKPSSLTAGY